MFLTPRDILAIFYRRLAVILLIGSIGAVASYIAALRQPHVYETAAVLQVELPMVAAEMTGAAAGSRMAQRLQLLEQELLSRDAILALVDAHGLFTEFPAMTMTDKVVVMRQSIRIETVRASGTPFAGEAPISAMLIVVRMQDRVKAAEVANDLASKVLELTAERSSEQIRETLEFYAGQEARVGEALAALEAEVTAFKNANVDALPEALQDRRDEIVRIETQIQAFDLQLLALRQELSALTSREAPRAIERRQIVTLNSQIDALDGQRSSAVERRRQVEDAIRRAPAVEMQLGTFTRRQLQMQEQFSMITARRAAAETTQRLDTDRQTERFTLLEEALPPDYPLSSGRRKIMILGLGVSGMLGLGIAYLLEMRNPVIRTARQFERALEIRPVIALPELGTPKRRRKRKPVVSAKRGDGPTGVFGSLKIAAAALFGAGRSKAKRPTSGR